jgi:hypothetical protein
MSSHEIPAPRRKLLEKISAPDPLYIFLCIYLSLHFVYVVYIFGKERKKNKLYKNKTNLDFNSHFPTIIYNTWL